MDEAEFDSLADWRPFERADAGRYEAAAARCTRSWTSSTGKYVTRSHPRRVRPA